MPVLATTAVDIDIMLSTGRYCIHPFPGGGVAAIAITICAMRAVHMDMFNARVGAHLNL